MLGVGQRQPLREIAHVGAQAEARGAQDGLASIGHGVVGATAVVVDGHNELAIRRANLALFSRHRQRGEQGQR